MRIATVSEVHGRGGEKWYRLYVHSSPLWKYLVQRTYHAYDVRVPVKVPGWKHIDRLARRLGGEIMLGVDDPPERLRDRLVAWTIKQDIRCFELTEWSRDTICWVDITQEQFLKIKEHK